MQVSEAVREVPRGVRGVRLGRAFRQAFDEAELHTFLPALGLVAGFHGVVALLLLDAELPVAYPWRGSVDYLVRYTVGIAVGGFYVLLPLLLSDFRHLLRGGQPPVDLATRLEHFIRMFVAGFPGAWIFVLMLLGNANLKPAIPVLNPVRFDGQLEAFERALCLGVLPTQWLVSGMSRLAYGFWDFVYSLFGTFILVSLAIAIHFEGMRGGARLLTAVCTGYILCAFCALAYPTLGPVYVHPEWFTRFDGSQNARLVAELAARASAFEKAPSVRFVVAGIAAMPSFHVCSWATGLMCWRPLPRAVFGLGVVLVLLNWMSTVALGWHYALDGVAGIALALLGSALAGWMVPSHHGATVAGFARRLSARHGPGSTAEDCP